MPAKNGAETSLGDRFAANSALGLYTALLLLSSVGNQVYFKRMTSAMQNYGWYLTQLSTLIYVPVFAFLAGSGLLHQSKPGLLKKFSVMGFFDGIAGSLMVLGGVQTSGTMQVLISQAIIPITILLSVLLLRKQYHSLQYTGAAIIVCGIILSKTIGGGGDDDGNNPVFNALFLVAMVPAALSSVFKEVAFKGFDGDLDVNVLQFWVAMFQVVVNFCAMPIYTLHVLGTQRVPLEDMPGLLVKGTRCLFFLENQVTTYCGAPHERACDECHTAWRAVSIYMCFNLLYNVFTILVIKHGSAALSFLVATLRMPMASLAFGSSAIMGSEAVAPGMSDGISLVVILAGLFTYRYGGQRLKPTEMPIDFASPSPSEDASPSPSSMLSEPLRKGATKAKFMFAPLFNMGGVPRLEPTFVIVRAPQVAARTAVRVRHDLYHKLGAASPLHSPQLRHMSPPASPFASPRPQYDGMNSGFDQGDLTDEVHITELAPAMEGRSRLDPGFPGREK